MAHLNLSGILESDLNHSHADSRRRGYSLHDGSSRGRGYGDEEDGGPQRSHMSEHHMKQKLSKLDAIEKKFKEEKNQREDQNRGFVIRESSVFLKAIADEEPGVAQQESSSSDSSLWEGKKAKQTKMFIIDQGRRHDQPESEWEKNLLERGLREAQRVYLTPANSLQPFAVMSYLPYGIKKRIPTEQSSSSNQTFSSSEHTATDQEDTDSSYSDSSGSSSSRKDSFDQPRDGPKCHRGHIHIKRQWQREMSLKLDYEDREGNQSDGQNSECDHE